MKIKNLVSLAVFAVVLLSVPASTFAYFTTAQSAVRINDETVLYTVTYSFGTNKYDMLLPIAALRKDTKTDFINYLGYSLISVGREVSEGVSNAFVLSSAEVKGNQYFIPKGKSRDLTLVSLVTLPKKTSENLKGLSLQVTSLPFILVDGMNEIKNGLNPSELQYYVTPAVKF